VILTLYIFYLYVEVLLYYEFNMSILLALASKNHNAIVFTALPYVILNVPVPRLYVVISVMHILHTVAHGHSCSRCCLFSPEVLQIDVTHRCLPTSIFRSKFNFFSSTFFRPSGDASAIFRLSRCLYSMKCCIIYWYLDSLPYPNIDLNTYTYFPCITEHYTRKSFHNSPTFPYLTDLYVYTRISFYIFTNTLPVRLYPFIVVNFHQFLTFPVRLYPNIVLYFHQYLS
ncbi:hypothetical protein L9F63_028250, partial [Diploptera punctata]